MFLYVSFPLISLWLEFTWTYSSGFKKTPRAFFSRGTFTTLSLGNWWCLWGDKHSIMISTSVWQREWYSMSCLMFCGRVLSVIMFSLAIVQLKVWARATTGESQEAGRERERAEAGQTTSSMEFLKAGSNWRLSVCLCSCGGSRRAACQCVTL